VLSLLMLAATVGISNMAASVGIGMAGVDNRVRVRIVLVFGLFEAIMPLVGLALGHGAASQLGSGAGTLGGALLVLVGSYTVYSGLHATEQSIPTSDRLGRLVVMGFALSIDNLVVGFALGTVRVSFIVAASVIGAVSVAMSVVGLELGGRLGSGFEHRGEVIGGAVLTLVGIALAVGLLG
jgi:manganese efflux pump family protein